MSECKLRKKNVSEPLRCGCILLIFLRGVCECFFIFYMQFHKILEGKSERVVY